MAKEPHKKGKVAPGKVNVSARLLIGPWTQAEIEAERLGFSNRVAFLNWLLVQYFNGDTIRRDP